MSRNSIKALEEEINFLRITIQHFNMENIEMKNRIEDLKITLESDKKILQEYLLQISDKDSTVIKLNHTIEQLKKRLENLEPQKMYTTNKIRYSSPQRTDTNNPKSRHIGNISMRSTKVAQPRALSVLKSRKIFDNKIDIVKKDIKKVKSNKMAKINTYQERLKLELMQTRHKLELVQHMYLRTIEKLKQGKKLTSVILYDEKLDQFNQKIINDNIPLNELTQKNFDDNVEKAILFMDNKGQVWEMEPQPLLTEDILKKGDYKYIQNFGKIEIDEQYDDIDKNSNNILDNDDELDISINHSFYNDKNEDNNNISELNIDNKDKKNDNNIYQESQESNLANIGDFQTEYK